MRLFVALILEPDWLEVLARIQERLRPLDPGGSVRWTDPRGIHLTLKFLGEVQEARVPSLEMALEGAVRGLFAPVLGLGALGAFPNFRRPRVLWIGVREEGNALAPLAAAVEASMGALGWEAEGRPFQAHLTLGRVREQRVPEGIPKALAQGLTAELEPREPAIHHPRVALIRSHLSASGARYEEVRVWTLERPA